METDDSKDFVAKFTFNVEASPLSIATRKGCLERDLSWIETLIATDYTKLRRVVGYVSNPMSPTSSAIPIPAGTVNLSTSDFTDSRTLGVSQATQELRSAVPGSTDFDPVIEGYT